MSSALTTIANVTAADLTAADAFGGFLVLIVAILSFLAISGLALSMTIGASKSPGTMAITGIAGLLSVLIAAGLFMTVTAHHALKIDGCPAEFWDRLGGMLATVIGLVALLSIGGLLVTSAMAAFSSSKTPVSSWPQHEEHLFSVYDQRIAAAQSRAWAVGIAGGVAFFLFAVGVYQGVTPDMKDLSKDMNMDNLTKKSKEKAEPPKVEPPKAEAPKVEPPKAEPPKAEPEKKQQ